MYITLHPPTITTTTLFLLLLFIIPSKNECSRLIIPSETSTDIGINIRLSNIRLTLSPVVCQTISYREMQIVETVCETFFETLLKQTFGAAEDGGFETLDLLIQSEHNNNNTNTTSLRNESMFRDSRSRFLKEENKEEESKVVLELEGWAYFRFSPGPNVADIRNVLSEGYRERGEMLLVEEIVAEVLQGNETSRRICLDLLVFDRDGLDVGGASPGDDGLPPNATMDRDDDDEEMIEDDDTKKGSHGDNEDLDEAKQENDTDSNEAENKPTVLTPTKAPTNPSSPPEMKTNSSLPPFFSNETILTLGVIICSLLLFLLSCIPFVSKTLLLPNNNTSTTAKQPNHSSNVKPETEEHAILPHSDSLQFRANWSTPIAEEETSDIDTGPVFVPPSSSSPEGTSTRRSNSRPLDALLSQIETLQKLTSKNVEPQQKQPSYELLPNHPTQTEDDIHEMMTTTTMQQHGRQISLISSLGNDEHSHEKQNNEQQEPPQQQPQQHHPPTPTATAKWKHKLFSLFKRNKNLSVEINDATTQQQQQQLPDMIEITSRKKSESTLSSIDKQRYNASQQSQQQQQQQQQQTLDIQSSGYNSTHRPQQHVSSFMEEHDSTNDWNKASRPQEEEEEKEEENDSSSNALQPPPQQHHPPLEMETTNTPNHRNNHHHQTDRMPPSSSSIDSSTYITTPNWNDDVISKDDTHLECSSTKQQPQPQPPKQQKIIVCRSVQFEIPKKQRYIKINKRELHNKIRKEMNLVKEWNEKQSRTLDQLEELMEFL